MAEREEPPVLKPGVDLSRSGLTMDQGLLASLVDGKTPSDKLALVAGWPEEKVRSVLEQLKDKGMLANGKTESKDPYEGFIFPVPLMVEPAELSEAEKKRIIWFHSQFQKWNHYEVLQARRRDDAKAIKAAYQHRSKEWYPDRWLRTRGSSFYRMVEENFKRVNEAYRVLSNPKQREAYDAEHADFVVDEEDLIEMRKAARRKEREAVREQERLERRRKRNPIRKRLHRAEEFKNQAEELVETGDLSAALRAAQSAELYGLHTEDLKEMVERLRNETGEQKAGPLVKKGDTLRIHARWEAAESYYREVLRHVPGHPEASKGLSYVILQMGGDPNEALRYAKKAEAGIPQDPDAHYFLGLCYEAVEMVKPAKSAYSRTLELKPNHQEAKKRLRKLQWGF